MTNRADDVLIYPVLDLYCCPRASGQKINNSKIPLLKYTEPISANNCSKTYDADTINSRYLREIKEQDGMISSFKRMKNYSGGDNNGLPIGNIKVLICVCMYNQSKYSLNLTLNGIYSNLRDLKNGGIDPGDIAVVLVQDGILKLIQDRKRRTLAKGQQSMVNFYKKLDRNLGKEKCDLQQRINVILQQIDNYNKKGMGNRVALNRDFPPSIEKNVSLVYQNLWKPSYTHFDGQQQYADSQQEFLRVFSCFKHTNGTKLSSHLWFFEGFCRYLKPQFCVLLDVGTKPQPKGIYNLIKGFKRDVNIGGCTGFMSVDPDFKSQEGDADPEQGHEQSCIAKCFVSVQKAQEYEYIISHFLDKNAQSALGFLHVLPGAWSAYRYEALTNSEKFQLNLLQKSYFKMILNPDIEEGGYEQANMYLAEDRILSLGIYCQTKNKYYLKYVPDAVAKTDPMKDHENLMNQRRRWINSSLFAFMYVFANFHFNAADSEHSCTDKYIYLNLSMYMALLSFFISYIAPSVYFFIIYSTIYQMGFPGADWAAKLVGLTFVLVFLSAVAGALTGRQWSKYAHTVSAAFAVFNFMLLLLVVYNIFVIYFSFTSDPFIPGSQPGFDPNNLTSDFKMMSIIIVAAITIGSSILLCTCHLLSPIHAPYVIRLICDTPSYIAYTGAYALTMVIHGFCNVDDVSWGTKGSTGSNGGKKYEINKVFWVSSWLFWNCLLSFIFLYVDIIMLEVDPESNSGGYILIIIAYFGALTIGVKTFLALCYHLKWMLVEKCCDNGLINSNQRYREPLVENYWQMQAEKWKKNYQKHHGIAHSRIYRNQR